MLNTKTTVQITGVGRTAGGSWSARKKPRGALAGNSMRYRRIILAYLKNRFKGT
jgi:hypothetical protein